jgi:magnesium transporter
MQHTELERLVLPEIRELLEVRDLATLRDVLADWEPADLAAIVADLDADDRTWVFRSLEEPAASHVFGHLDYEVQEELGESLPPYELSKILNGMAPDDRTAFLEQLPIEWKQRILSLLSPEERRVAESLLAYPEDSVGRLMTPDYLAVRERWTVERVLDFVRNYGKDSETLTVIYVADDHGRLVDDLRIREILLAPLRTDITALMDRQFISLRVDDPQELAVELFRKYDRTVLPVVTADDVLVGIVTIDDVLDVAEEQATREIQMFGGVEALDEPYDATPVLELVRKRGMWLILLFAGEMLTATAMTHFEHEIAMAPVLALFLPLIISSGGNSGSQAATLLVRALALGEVKLKQWGRVLGRELISGLLLGIVLGAIGFCRIALWSAFSDVYGPHWFLVACTVGVALVGIVLWGTISGAMLPFVLKKLGFDPATSSAPLVATMVDVTGLIIYFTVALFFLRGTLLK